MIGETIGNFTIVSQLGSGGMGDVFLAEQNQIHTKVAIKLLHANISTDHTQIDRFFNEARAVSTIKHAGIVRIFDLGFTATGRAYLVMEFLEGETLSARIEKAGRLSIADVADIGRQTAGVLAATHAEGVVHRDLKPDNIYLVRDAEMARGERVKILDFGIAKLANINLTGSANSMGTPTYMAPEQWNNSGKVDWRADLYSLGCVAFEMVAGRPPFVATSIGEACAMHLSEPPPPVTQFAPECPPALAALLARMLAKSPDDRPASMAEVAAGFSAHADSPTGPMYAVGPPTGAYGAPLAQTMPTGGGVHASSAGAALAPALSATAPAQAAAPSPQMTEVVPRKKGRGALLAVGAIVLVGGAAAAVALGMKSKEPPAPKHEPKARDAGVAAVPKDAAAVVVATPSDAGPGDGSALGNPFIDIPLPPKPIVLGVDSDSAPDTERGFRPARKVMSPTAPFAIQPHEVTWSELEPYLAAHDQKIEFPPWAQDPVKRAKFPATNVTWQLAHEYCVSIKGELPTEEEWELAARGAERRPYAWGNAKLDRMLTRTLVGPTGEPQEVMRSDQDKTPTLPLDRHIFDLIGNVQEWTEGLWREDKAGADEAWVEDGDTTYRALRGLPLHGNVKGPTWQVDAAAYREPACATGDCKGKFVPPLDAVGFRCAQNEKSKAVQTAVGPVRPKVVDAGVASAPPVDAAVIAKVTPDASVADCTFESCQASGMEGACCAKKFPKKAAPPLPEKPPQSEANAKGALLQSKVRDCAAHSPRVRGNHRVTLHVAPSGHVDTFVTSSNAAFRNCIIAAGNSLTFSPSRDGADELVTITAGRAGPDEP